MKKFASYQSCLPNSRKIFVLAFLYVLAGSLALFVFELIRMVISSLSGFANLFPGPVIFVLLICVTWGLFFGYVPTLLCGIILYFLISYRFQTGWLSKLHAIFYGVVGAGLVSSSVSFYMLSVFFRLPDQNAFLPDFFVVSLIATLVGAFAGAQVYDDVKQRFSGGTSE